MIAGRTCLQNYSDVAGQTVIPGRFLGKFCYLSTHDYLWPDATFLEHYQVKWDTTWYCKVNKECLAGIIYSMDIGYYGPFFYKLQNICVDSVTGAKRVTLPWVAEEDAAHPDYLPTPAYQADVRIDAKPTCWNSEFFLSRSLVFELKLHIMSEH